MMRFGLDRILPPGGLAAKRAFATATKGERSVDAAGRPATAVPPTRLGRPFDPNRLSDQLRLSFLWFAGNALWEAVLTVILPFIVLQDVGDARKALALSLLSTLGTLLASIVHPIAGWASDATRTPFGRRRPYLLGGGIVAVAGLIWMAVGRGYAELVAAILLLQLGYNVALAAYQAYIPEIAPAEGRGQASGFLGLASSVGALVGAMGAAFLVHGSTYRFMLAFLAALLLSGIAVTIWGLPEAQPVACTSLAANDRQAVLGRYHDFLWVVITRGLVMLAFYTLLTYLAYYLQDVQHLVHYTTDTSYVVAVTIAAAAGSTLWAGRRSDAIGRRAIVCGAGALMGVAAACFVFVHGLMAILVVGVFFGLGYGAYISVDWALITDVLPESSGIARDMGIWGLAITVPQVLAPLIAGGFFLLLPGGTAAYTGIFGLTCIYALLGSALVWQVRGVR